MKRVPQSKRTSFGLSDTDDRVEPLPPRPHSIEEEWENLNDAWRAFDVTLLATDGDREMADRAFEQVRRKVTDSPYTFSWNGQVLDVRKIRGKV